MSETTKNQTPTADHRRPLLLVVDDERVIADTLATILRQNGFQTLTAYDGESALEMVRNAVPNVLLSDVMMGSGMDGTELAMEVLRAHPKCRVLLFSGHTGTHALLQKARAAGYDFRLLHKPLHPTELLAELKEMFGEPGTAE